jgi:hypothetical protein
MFRDAQGRATRPGAQAPGVTKSFDPQLAASRGRGAGVKRLYEHGSRERLRGDASQASAVEGNCRDKGCVMPLQGVRAQALLDCGERDVNKRDIQKRGGRVPLGRHCVQ